MRTVVCTLTLGYFQNFRHVQFRFSSFEEATAAVEKIEKVKEGLTVKQLVGGLNVGE